MSMPKPELTELQSQIDKLRAVLTVMDTNLELGRIPSEGMHDLQKTIDGLRANVWVLLKAWHRTQEQSFVTRMRVRRARETCDEVLADLSAGTLPAETPGYSVFRATLRELAQALAAEGT